MKGENRISNFYKENKLIIILSGIAVLIHFFVNAFTHYGIFRDELYYIACSKRLAFGYVDQPPLSALILFFNNLLLGDSVFAIRILPALSHGAAILFSGLIAKEFGGNKTAQVITSLCVLIAPVYLVIFNFYSMNSFDILFWIVCIYLIIRIINTEDQKLWIVVGVITGLAFENKLSILFLSAAIFFGLLLSTYRKYLLNKYYWIGAAIAILLSIPNIIWQAVNNWPTLEFMRNATEHKNAPISLSGFTIEQLMQMNPITILVWLPGLLFILFSRRLKNFRLFGIAYLFLFTLFVVQNGKPYYLSPIYPVLFAAGSIALENLLTKYKWTSPALITTMVSFGLIVSPIALPLLPPETYIVYRDSLGIKPGTGERDNPGPLGQHFADMFGWKEMSDMIMKSYNSLTPEEKDKCAVFVQNYGQAGAIEYFGQQNGKPLVISGHNNYWIWGYGSCNGDVLIIVDADEEDLKKEFDSYYKAGTIFHKYSRSFENNLPVYVCKGYKLSVQKIWPRVKHFM